MTATTPSLAALPDAAREEPPDRLALLTLADLAEEAGDDALADSWRWLADVPEVGWERRAWEVLRSTAEGPDVAVRIDLGSPAPTVWADARGAPGDLTCRLGRESRGHYVWRRKGGWRFHRDDRPRSEPCGWDGGSPPPEVRAACLAACRAALAGCHR